MYRVSSRDTWGDVINNRILNVTGQKPTLRMLQFIGAFLKHKIDKKNFIEEITEIVIP